MKVTNSEKKENSTVELIIHVEAEQFEAAVEKAYRKNRGQISVPGFRKGKAPRKIIEGMYGSGVFYEEAVNSVYPGAYDEAVKEQGLDDVGYPNVEIVDVGKDGMTFKALVAVRPEVTLGQYKGLTAPKDAAEVTDEDIENELKPFISRATRLVPVERAAKDGDTAVIDFEGFSAGVPFDGGKGENYSLVLGSGSFVPGFEEQIVGLKTGDEKEINITFPEDYVPDLAGKDVVFKVKVQEIKESQSPEVDDEFAKDVSEFETLEAFKADLKQKVAARREEEAQQSFEESIFEQLVDNMTCEIPEGMVDVQLDKLMDDYAMRLQAQGISMEQYTQMMGMDVNTMRISSRPSAKRQVQMRLALEAVAAAENMEITDEEVKEEIARLAEEYKMEVEKVEAAVPAADLKQDLKMKKASELLIESAKVGPAPVKAEAAEEAKPKKTTRKKAEKATEDGEEKPKKTTRKKKTEATEETAGE